MPGAWSGYLGATPPYNSSINIGIFTFSFRSINNAEFEGSWKRKKVQLVLNFQISK
ncbi:hypothetical protein CLV42_101869 [Chitinophaga ginsengisoli]|uniref:Uncharacterized protein n=1 Tax=Chitinophaga ginsengisoli TaxID=363837 RepID=A0A2P8GQ61_9BACT|nr:hypothetical protein CLV42_101869 [Chitinophaga ginsengisoli]